MVENHSPFHCISLFPNQVHRHFWANVHIPEQPPSQNSVTAVLTLAIGILPLMLHASAPQINTASASNSNSANRFSLLCTSHPSSARNSDVASLVRHRRTCRLRLFTIRAEGSSVNQESEGTWQGTAMAQGKQKFVARKPAPAGKKAAGVLRKGGTLGKGVLSRLAVRRRAFAPAQRYLQCAETLP